MPRTFLVLVLVFMATLGPAASGSAQQWSDRDDCEAGFIAYLGANAYQFSPLLPGELGVVRIHGELSFQRAAMSDIDGTAAWRLEIWRAGARDRVVRTAEGQVALSASTGRAGVDFQWDGRDDEGHLVPPGLYEYTVLARFLEGSTDWPLSFAELEAQGEGIVARPSDEELVVDYGLDPGFSREIRQTLATSACASKTNSSLEPGFAYNFFYGSTHSHSNYSDGGQPLATCSSGRSYGSGDADPAAVYAQARDTAGLDYWVVNEHNHLMDDAVSYSDAPLTEAKVRDRYAAGLAAAVNASVPGSFVGLYGMEWGVTTNADQGHVTLIETPSLFGWESCTGCNGPAAECTPGTNCYFSIFTPKRYGYLQMYRRSVENPSPAGALGIFCHPSSGEFDGFAFDGYARDAMQGIAVRSGLAFTTATDCADANVGSTDFTARFKDALNRGFRVAPTADHDAHCDNCGVSLPTRTVYLVPASASPALTRANITAAHRARHFFASEDSNAQLAFGTSDYSRVMGDIFATGSSVTLKASVRDPDNEGVSRIELWRGQVGAGIPSSPLVTVTGTSVLTRTETFTSGSYYYWVRAVQADGHDVWSAPMWISFNGMDISGWRLTQTSSSITYTFPAGTWIPGGGYLVIARDASQPDFESFWRGGSPLPEGAFYLSTGGVFPSLDGGETLTLYDNAGRKKDGATIAMPAGGLKTLQRKDPCAKPGTTSSWNVLAWGSANPGAGAGAGCAKGVVINEFADPGTGTNAGYEFVEMHLDR